MVNRLLILLIVVLASVSILGAFNGLSNPAPTSPPVTLVSVQPEEDSPQWDCRTMGNGWCSTIEVDQEDGSTVVLCEDDLILYSPDGSDDVDSLVCRLDPALSI